MPGDIKISELDRLLTNADNNVVAVNDRESLNDIGTTKKIKTCNFLTDNIVKERHFNNQSVTGDKIKNNTITEGQIQARCICNNNLDSNSVNNRIIDNGRDFKFNCINVQGDIIISKNINLCGNVRMVDLCEVDTRDISADGDVLDELHATTYPALAEAIEDIKNNIGDGTLNLESSGIAEGTQTFKANQATDATFTINVPGTDLTYSSTTTTGIVKSSTGTNATIPTAAGSLTGLMTSAIKSKLDGIAAGAQVNVATNLTYNTATTTGTVNSSTGTSATIPAATNILAGLMTSTDKTKLNGIAADAQVNSITSVAGRTNNIILSACDVGLNNVKNCQQVRASSSATNNNVPTWVNSEGISLNNGCVIATTLNSSTPDNNLVRGSAIKAYVDNEKISVDSVWYSGIISLEDDISSPSINIGFEPKFIVVYPVVGGWPDMSGGATPLVYRDIHSRATFIPPLEANYTQKYIHLFPPTIDEYNRSGPVATGPNDWLWHWHLRFQTATGFGGGESFVLKFLLTWETKTVFKIIHKIGEEFFTTVGNENIQIPLVRLYVVAYR
jgi:hypothetical protein